MIWRKLQNAFCNRVVELLALRAVAPRRGAQPTTGCPLRLTRLFRPLCADGMLAARALPPCIALLVGCIAPAAFAQSTAFTYQGRLDDGGAQANGIYDLRFAIYDATTAGAQQGPTLTNAATAVSNGLFTATLNFGNQFPGPARWLEIGVRTNGGGAFFTLSPRQPVTPTPYAITAGGLSGALPLSQLPAAVVTNGASGVNLVGTFTGSGAGLSNLPAASLPAGVTLVSADPQDATLLGAGMQRFMTVPAPTWTGGTASGAPANRSEHSAVWTGSTVLIWGGNVGSGTAVATGSGYSPDADQWTQISTTDAPSARRRHSAVWSGQEMIVWGGVSSGGYLDSGGRYDPTTLLWSLVATSNVPSARADHIAAWTGQRMIIWGGRDGGGLFNDGALYDPAANVWSTLSLPSTPEARMSAASVWAGDRLIIWGGVGEFGELANGGRLLVTGGTNATQWLPINTTNAPSPRTGHSLVWTGSRAIVWGGRNAGTPLADGGIYDPVNDSWQPLPVATNSPSARSGHVTAWTGTEMLIWSGETISGATASGAAYNPTTSQWRTLTASGATARTESTAIWSGTELVVFGGRNGVSPVGALQRLNPQPAWHFFRKP